MDPRKVQQTERQPAHEEGEHSAPFHRGYFPAFRSFQYRDYLCLWLGTVFSFLAVGMQRITRAWLVLRLTNDSPFALSLVIVSFTLPLTFVSVLGGVFADRISRRQIILIAQSGNAILTFLLATLDMMNIICFWHLLVIGFCNGTLAAFNMPSRQSIISDIVPEQNLMNAISLSSAGMNLTNILGPVLAGVFIVYLDTAGVFYLIALFHAFSVVCTILIKAGRTPSAVSPRKGMWVDLREGFQYAAGNPTLLGLVIMGLVPALFGFTYLNLLPVWGREVLDAPSDGLGLLMAFVGIGALIGTLVLASLPYLKRRGSFLMVNGFVWGIALIAFSLCNSYITALPALLLIGFLSAIFMSLNMTLMQFYSSPEMRGRIVSMSMMTFGIMPLSTVPFGILAESIGTADSLKFSGLLLCLFIIVFFFAFRRFRKVA